MESNSDEEIWSQLQPLEECKKISKPVADWADLQLPEDDKSLEQNFPLLNWRPETVDEMLSQNEQGKNIRKPQADGADLQQLPEVGELESAGIPQLNEGKNIRKPQADRADLQLPEVGELESAARIPQLNEQVPPQNERKNIRKPQADGANLRLPEVGELESAGIPQLNEQGKNIIKPQADRADLQLPEAGELESARIPQLNEDESKQDPALDSKNAALAARQRPEILVPSSQPSTSTRAGATSCATPLPRLAEAGHSPPASPPSPPSSSSSPEVSPEHKKFRSLKEIYATTLPLPPRGPSEL